MWDEWLSFPIKYRELPRNAVLGITVWGVGAEPVAATTVPMFTVNGRLRDGVECLKLTPKVIADSSIFSSTKGLMSQDMEYQEILRVEKLREEYERNQMPAVEWLDRLTFKEMTRARQATEVSAPDEPISVFSDPTKHYSTIWIKFPYYGFPVLHEEESYHRLHAPTQSTAVVRMQSHEKTRLDSLPPSAPFQMLGKASTVGTDSTLEGKNSNQLNLLTAVYDPEIDEENPVEWKYRKLARGILRGVIDRNLKPNREEKARLERILHNPSDALRSEDKDLLWKFRYSLTDNRKAVTKFLLCVDWNDEQEEKQATELLEKWSETAPIDIADALKLLGRQKEYKNDHVRRFAVETLSQARDDELLDYLLQLVQAMRYEQIVRAPTEDGTEEEAPIGLLAKFLITRACKSLRLANYFYWYLKVELDDPVDGSMFQQVFRTLLHEMKRQSLAVHDMLAAQEELFSQVGQAHQKARDERGRKDQKEGHLRKSLKSLSWPKDHKVLRLPLDPTIQVTAVVPSSAKMFKSALYPAVIDFKTCTASDAAAADDEDKRDSELRRRLSKKSRMTNIFSRDEGSVFKVMFKNGDDLRQDQLIMQMFILMDRLLKRVNLDLKLTPYRILATSTYDGTMEFVLDSCPVSHVVAEYETPQILSFLRKHNPDPSGDFGVSPEALGTYVKSVAGYCVLTYILGIGDRHLDNLMVKTQGNLFHIDFGCVFGRDPKPYPPPFKLTKEMVEGMGGVSSEHYVRFKTYCCQAYNWLRKSASLILNLLSLMVDAGIDELSTDPETTLTKVQEKFRLDLTDEQAEQFFLGLINDSVTALFPVLMEYIHKVATKLR